MALPTYDEFFGPVLKVLSESGELPVKEIRSRVAVQEALTPEDLGLRIKSGMLTFDNRIHWALSYLTKAGLASRPRRGVYAATPQGVALIGSGRPLTLDVLLEGAYGIAEWRSAPRTPRTTSPGDKSSTNAPEPRGDSRTPEEELEQAHADLRSATEGELLEIARGVQPAQFERVVLDLLQAMGYGGSLDNAARVLGRSGDGGVDGVIDEDKLGLERIYLQAKRYKDGSTIGRPEIQSFVGSLEGKRATKGVFLTTAVFSREAREYVETIGKRVVLIDGTQLARLMFEHNVGVSTQRAYEVKRVDSDYFDEL